MISNTAGPPEISVLSRENYHTKLIELESLARFYAGSGSDADMLKIIGVMEQKDNSFPSEMYQALRKKYSPVKRANSTVRGVVLVATPKSPDKVPNYDEILRFRFENGQLVDRCAEELCGRVKIQGSWIDVPEEYKRNADRHRNYNTDYLCTRCESKMKKDTNRLNYTFGLCGDFWKIGKKVDDIIDQNTLYAMNCSDFAVLVYAMDNKLMLIQHPNRLIQANGRMVSPVRNKMKEQDQEIRGRVSIYPNIKRHDESELEYLARVPPLVDQYEEKVSKK